VGQVQIGLHVEQRSLQVRRRALPIVADAVLARLGFDHFDEIGQRIDGQAGCGGQHAGADGHTADGREVLDRVIGQLHQRDLLQQRHDAEQHRVAISRRFGHQVGANRAASAGLVLDHHRLLPVVLHLLGHHAGQRVGGAACRIRNDKLDGLARVACLGLCTTQQSQAGHGRQGQSAGEFFHGVSPVVVVKKVLLIPSPRAPCCAR
jgi:hypothetical protein